MTAGVAAAVQTRTPAATGVPSRAGDEVRLRDGIRYAVLVFAAVWAGWALLGLLGVMIFPPRNTVAPPGFTADQLSVGWHNMFTPGNRQDALWYQRIATEGYHDRDAGAAFFPLYPGAISLVALLPWVGPLLAATLISQACFLGSLVVLYALTVREFDQTVARRTVLYLAIFPTAFFFLSPYTEGPFLLLTVLAFWYARGNRWPLAIVPGLLAGTTRSAAVALAAGLAVEAYSQWRAPGRPLLPRLAVAAAPVVGIAGYLAYWGLAHDDLLAPLDAQAAWKRQFAGPLDTVLRGVVFAVRHQSYWLIDLLVVGAVVAALCIGLRRLPWSYLTYSLVSLLLPLSAMLASRPFMSMPRFVAVLFPAFWVVALAVGRGKIPEQLVIGVSCAGYALLGVLFMNWYQIY
jgi:hypothetical protein